MGEYTATISWRREGAAFADNRYSRAHKWTFDGGAAVSASASPHIVPVPLSDPSGVDPEEAYVAAMSSCHMLFVLSLAAKKKLIVDSYEDHAVGAMEKGADGAMWMARVSLRPRIIFSGAQPTPTDITALHHEAHAMCYLANSVKTVITIEP